MNDYNSDYTFNLNTNYQHDTEAIIDDPFGNSFGDCSNYISEPINQDQLNIDFNLISRCLSEQFSTESLAENVAFQIDNYPTQIDYGIRTYDDSETINESYDQANLISPNENSYIDSLENKARINARNYRSRQRQIKAEETTRSNEMEMKNRALHKKVNSKEESKRILNVYKIKLELEKETQHLRKTK